MNDRVTAFCPCRKGSQRVHDKNTRPFAGVEGGLARIKLGQLCRCPGLTAIVVSTDDPQVVDLAARATADHDRPIRIVERPPGLATSETSTDNLIRHVPDLIDDGVVLWTHATSPFVDEHIYGDALRTYRDQVEQGRADSLMSVTRIQSFLWNAKGPVNYDRAAEKWPRTQTLPEWFEVNSAIFIAPVSTYVKTNDRIGTAPHLYALPFPASLDVDTMAQFEMAERLWAHVE